jgi:hypothetical protein
MVRYATCWVGEDGIYSCGHEHESVADAMQCLIPNGGEFIRACESGVFRSLSEDEVVAFLAALRYMPWRSPGWG